MTNHPRVEQISHPHWPRYRIVLGDAAWTGKGWGEKSLAAIWASMPLVVKELREVTRTMNGDHPEKTFIATVSVTVRTGSDFRLDELAAYLAENTHVHLDQEPPPLVDSAIVDIQIDWSGLRENEGTT